MPIFRILGVLLGLWCVSVAGADPGDIVHISGVSCRFSADQKRALVTFRLKIADGWFIQGAGSRFSEGPKFGLGELPDSSLPMPKSFEVVWPSPVWMFKDGFHVPMYQETMVVPLQLNFEEMTQKAGFLGTFFLFACKENQCRPIQVPVSYELESPGEVRLWHPEAPVSEAQSLGWILVLAFLGGCLLNVMPCVLPILGVKLLAFTQRRCPKGLLVVRDLWASVFGIVFAFLLLAGIVTLLKLFGSRVGWGFHFQNPYFASCMAAMLVAFIGNVWGVFEFNVPGSLQKQMGLCMHTTRAFLTGVLSVFVATPCTAPFVGTAVGFALSRDTADIWAVFLMMALGFASPYWVAALLPSHRIHLPRPGRWMLWVQGVITALMLGALSWFVFLLAGGVSFFYGASLGLCAGGTLVAFWALSHHVPYARLAVCAGLVALILAPMWRPQPSQRDVATLESDVVWREFQPARIADLVYQGHTVFVDVMARWCLTCQINKRAVLQTPEVMAFFKKHKILCMRADWTEADGRIGPFLKRFGRAGIPFNIVFGKSAPQGIVLPEILTKDAVYRSITRALGEG